jgi:hypothetical protein
MTEIIKEKNKIDETGKHYEPEIKEYMQRLISGSLTEEDKQRYEYILKKLWDEYTVMCKEDARIIKSRNRIVDELTSW